jgi:hypothetical protein
MENKLFCRGRGIIVEVEKKISVLFLHSILRKETKPIYFVTGK